MAEKILKKVEDQLNCSVCLGIYTNPKLLQCFHTYCQQCLVCLVDRDQQGQLFLSCPICRQVTPVPDTGVAGLQTAFHINRLLEIVDEHKKEDDGENDRSDSIVPKVKFHPEHYCSEHADKELELYCETCEVLVCFHCTLKHHNHDYELLDAAFEKYKRDIASSLEPVQEKLTLTNIALAQLNRRCEEISHQQATIKGSIHKAIGRLREALDSRETKLIGELQQITQAKLKDLATQKDLIETTQAQLQSCLKFMSESFRTDSQREVLKMKTTVVRQVTELTTTVQPDTMRLTTEADVMFSALTDMTAVFQNYGQISAPSLPDSSQCHVTGKGLGEAMVGEESILQLHSINFMGTPCKEPIKSLECELVSELTGIAVEGSAERSGQSQYEIRYRPTVKGRHQFRIRVEGRPVKGSPFSIAVKSQLKKIGLPISLPNEASAERPWGVAITPTGDVVVTEYLGNCISVFSPDMKRLRLFGSLGSGKGQFNSPCGITVDGGGNVLVADSHNHRIQKFTTEGQFLTTVGSRGREPLHFECPLGIAFNPANGKVYVVDIDCIQVLHSDLTFCHTFGKEGANKGQFNLPWDVACDSLGKVYVTDNRNNRIQIFTAKGKFVRMLGQGRVAPTCIAIDSDNLVYVSDESGRVSVFTSEGQLLKEFGKKGEGPGEFKGLRGLAVDSTGVVYVCDRENNRIQLF